MTPLIILNGEAVRLGSSLSYLSITQENKGTIFGAHLRATSTKAHRVVLCSTVPLYVGSCLLSVGRARTTDTYSRVTYSCITVFLHSAPNWVPTALNARNVGDVLQKVHRRVPIRCTSAYCTVSYDDVKIIAYILPQGRSSTL